MDIFLKSESYVALFEEITRKRKRTSKVPQIELVRSCFASTLAVTQLCLTLTGKQKVYNFYTSMFKYIYVKPTKQQVWMMWEPFKKQAVPKLKGITGKLCIQFTPQNC